MPRKKKSVASTEMKVEFAPGCFDHFEGTQEELAEFMAEIQNMFATKSKAEIEAMSRPITEEMFNEMSEEEQERLMSAFVNIDELKQERNKKLN